MDFPWNVLVGGLAGSIPVAIGFWCARMMIESGRRQRREDAEANARIKAILGDNVRPSDLV